MLTRKQVEKRVRLNRKRPDRVTKYEFYVYDIIHRKLKYNILEKGGKKFKKRYVLQKDIQKDVCYSSRNFLRILDKLIAKKIVYKAKIGKNNYLFFNEKKCQTLKNTFDANKTQVFKKSIACSCSAVSNEENLKENKVIIVNKDIINRFKSKLELRELNKYKRNRSIRILIKEVYNKITITS